MKYQRNEAAWADLRFEAKAQGHRGLTEPGDGATDLSNVTDTFVDTGVRKILDISMSISVTRIHADLNYSSLVGV